MEYKLIGIRPTHSQMRQMVGKTLFRINNNWLEKVYVAGIKIGTDDKWKFVIASDTPLEENEPLFVSVKSATRYAKKHKIMLDYFPQKKNPN